MTVTIESSCEATVSENTSEAQVSTRVKVTPGIKPSRLEYKSPHNETHMTEDSLSDPGEGWTNSSISPMMYAYSQEGRISLYQSNRRWIHTSTGWSRTGDCDPNDPIATKKDTLSTPKKSICPKKEAEIAKSLMSQLSEKFYSLGWKPGTGGGISVRIGSGTAQDPHRVFSTPSGIQKEDMIGDDVFELDMNGQVVSLPKTPGLKLSSMTPLWFIVYKLRPSANCVIHTHSINSQLASMLDSSETASELRITHLEMIKGVGNHAYDSLLKIPIIANQPSEDLLGPDLEKVMIAYPKCNAVLVRRHGIYVWGDSWEQAKTQLESFDHLFEMAVKMKSLGVDCGVVPCHGNDERIKKERNDEQGGRQTTAEINSVLLEEKKEMEQRDIDNQEDNDITDDSTHRKRKRL